MEDADHDANDERERRRGKIRRSAKAAIISMEQSIIRANFYERLDNIPAYITYSSLRDAHAFSILYPCKDLLLVLFLI